MVVEGGVVKRWSYFENQSGVTGCGQEANALSTSLTGGSVRGRREGGGFIDFLPRGLVTRFVHPLYSHWV